MYFYQLLVFVNSVQLAIFIEKAQNYFCLYVFKQLNVEGLFSTDTKIIYKSYVMFNSVSTKLGFV